MHVWVTVLMAYTSAIIGVTIWRSRPNDDDTNWSTCLQSICVFCDCCMQAYTNPYVWSVMRGTASGLVICTRVPRRQPHRRSGLANPAICGSRPI